MPGAIVILQPHPQKDHHSLNPLRFPTIILHTYNRRNRRKAYLGDPPKQVYPLLLHQTHISLHQSKDVREKEYLNR